MARMFRKRVYLEAAQGALLKRLAAARHVSEATIILEAVSGMRRYVFLYRDAQLWATARLNQIATVYSEDFQTGARVSGVRFVNPLIG